jgi:TusA-related sulfurtransferase
MKLTKRDDGTIVADFQGLYGPRLQLTVKSFIGGLRYGESAEILLDDPETHEPIVMALRELCLQVRQEDPLRGTFKINVRK